MKSTIHKGCSCQFCKSGRPKKVREKIERSYRRKSKMGISNGDYTIYTNALGYTD